jgi:hypothetical protein
MEYLRMQDNLSIKIDARGGIDDTLSAIQCCPRSAAILEISGGPQDALCDFYEELARGLGDIRAGHAANYLDTAVSISRDIKPNATEDHFFCSTTMQPYHTDMAYVPDDEAGDWLILYCIKPSLLGGSTRVLSVNTLASVMEQFAPSLLRELSTDITWVYRKGAETIFHSKPILSEGLINWNYWQISRQGNSEEALSVCDRFFEFLSSKIEGANIYDVSKKWNAGDALLIRDREALHGRDAFFGDRWLKDHIIRSVS